MNDDKNLGDAIDLDLLDGVVGGCHGHGPPPGCGGGGGYGPPPWACGGGGPWGPPPFGGMGGPCGGPPMGGFGGPCHPPGDMSGFGAGSGPYTPGFVGQLPLDPGMGGGVTTQAPNGAPGASDASPVHGGWYGGR